MSVRLSSTDGALLARLRDAIRDVPDFPSPGILFRDVTPVLGESGLFREVTDAMAAPFLRVGITHVAGIESRGFILGAPVAQKLDAGFIPIRKKGKLPGPTVARSYGLEYGTGELEIHRDACPRGSRVLIVDDVLATGGTAAASAGLVQEVGGSVAAFSFLVALDGLKGSARLDGFEVLTLLRF